MTRSSGPAVSVRLAVEGGEAVKRSFDEIGESGQRTLQQFATAAGLSAGETDRLTRALSSAAIQIGSGASPLRVLLQQGLEVTRLFGAGTGIRSAISIIGREIVSFLSSPLALLTIGLSAAATAADAFFGSVNEGESTEDILARHKELVEAIQKSYDDAATAAGDYDRESRRVLLFQAQESERVLKERLTGASAEAADRIGLGGPLRAIGGGDILDRFNRSIADGMPDVLAFREAIVQLGNSIPIDGMERFGTVIPKTEISAFIQQLLDATQAAADLQLQLRKPLTVTARTAEDASMAAYTKQRDEEIGKAYERAVAARRAAAKQAADDTVREAEREVESLQRLAETWSEKAAPAVARYTAKLAEIDKARSYFETEADYLRARIALQNEMNDAVAEEERQRLLAMNTFGSGASLGLAEWADRAKEIAEQVRGSIIGALDGAEDALVEFVTTGKARFSDLVTSIAADLARLAIRQTILGPLSSALSGVFGGGNAGGTALQTPLSFGGPRAAGGPIETGKWYIAGEHGPEPVWGGGPGAFAAGYGAAAKAPAPVVNVTVTSEAGTRAEVKRQGDGTIDIRTMIDRSTAENMRREDSETWRELRRMGLAPAVR